jgi:hypothetical protein
MKCLPLGSLFFLVQSVFHDHVFLFKLSVLQHNLSGYLGIGADCFSPRFFLIIFFLVLPAEAELFARQEFTGKKRKKSDLSNNSEQRKQTGNSQD